MAFAQPLPFQPILQIILIAPDRKIPLEDRQPRALVACCAELLLVWQKLRHKIPALRQKQRFKCLPQFIDKLRIKLAIRGFHNDRFRIEQPGHIGKQKRKLWNCLLQIGGQAGVFPMVCHNLPEKRARSHPAS